MKAGRQLEPGFRKPDQAPLAVAQGATRGAPYQAHPKLHLPAQVKAAQPAVEISTYPKQEILVNQSIEYFTRVPSCKSPRTQKQAQEMYLTHT